MGQRVEHDVAQGLEIIVEMVAAVSRDRLEQPGRRRATPGILFVQTIYAKEIQSAKVLDLGERLDVARAVGLDEDVLEMKLEVGLVGQREHRDEDHL